MNRKVFEIVFKILIALIKSIRLTYQIDSLVLGFLVSFC